MLGEFIKQLISSALVFIASIIALFIMFLLRLMQIEPEESPLELSPYTGLTTDQCNQLDRTAINFSETLRTEDECSICCDSLKSEAQIFEVPTTC